MEPVKLIECDTPNKSDIFVMMPPQNNISLDKIIDYVKKQSLERINIELDKVTKDLQDAHIWISTLIMQREEAQNNIIKLQGELKQLRDSVTKLEDEIIYIKNNAIGM